MATIPSKKEAEALSSDMASLDSSQSLVNILTNSGE